MPISNQYESQVPPSTGKLLKAYFDKKRIRKNALARALGRGKTTLYTFIKNDSIQTNVLWDICLVLKHNFFADIASQLPREFSSDVMPDKSAEERIIELERQIEILKAQQEMLERVMIAKTK